jgi:hypothetical protein
MGFGSAHAECLCPRASRVYDAFGVFGAALQEKIDVSIQADSLKMVPKTPNASYLQVAPDAVAARE